ncbi:hypothetical protein HDU98_002487 [Podochytrium sp. JEL0797]|nr:hypothetical protein HDU98_002487 [Podochytrium sp. JEL0797]
MNTQSATRVTLPAKIACYGESRAFVTGEFDAWSQSVEMTKSADGSAFVSIPPLFLLSTATVILPATVAAGDKIQYKFVVDGVWKTSHAIPTTQDAQGNINNVFTVPAAITETNPETFLERVDAKAEAQTEAVVEKVHEAKVVGDSRAEAVMEKVHKVEAMVEKKVHDLMHVFDKKEVVKGDAAPAVVAPTMFVGEAIAAPEVVLGAGRAAAASATASPAVAVAAPATPAPAPAVATPTMFVGEAIAAPEVVLAAGRAASAAASPAVAVAAAAPAVGAPAVAAPAPTVATPTMFVGEAIAAPEVVLGTGRAASAAASPAVAVATPAPAAAAAPAVASPAVFVAEAVAAPVVVAATTPATPPIKDLPSTPNDKKTSPSASLKARLSGAFKTNVAAPHPIPATSAAGLNATAASAEKTAGAAASAEKPAFSIRNMMGGGKKKTNKNKKKK